MVMSLRECNGDLPEPITPDQLFGRFGKPAARTPKDSNLSALLFESFLGGAKASGKIAPDVFGRGVDSISDQIRDRATRLAGNVDLDGINPNIAALYIRDAAEGIPETVKPLSQKPNFDQFLSSAFPALLHGNLNPNIEIRLMSDAREAYRIKYGFED